MYVNGCNQNGHQQYQNFCTVQHLQQFAQRTMPPHVINTSNGPRVFFYDRHMHGENYEFSNFFPKSVIYNTHFCRTAEHAFQYAKYSYMPANAALITKLQQIAQQILDAPTPKIAAEIARNNAALADPSWHQTQASGFTKKEEVMFQVVKDKFTRHQNLQQKLLQTGNILLVEDSPVDSYWGRGANYQGENKLGRILMKIRTDIQQGYY